jgi:hypothetical protein
MSSPRATEKSPAGRNIRQGNSHVLVELPPEKGEKHHFNWVETVVKLVVSAVPTPCTAAMIASAMPAAINPYSMAVAPDSSDKNFDNVSRKAASF